MAQTRSVHARTQQQLSITSVAALLCHPTQWLCWVAGSHWCYVIESGRPTLAHCGHTPLRQPGCLSGHHSLAAMHDSHMTVATWLLAAGAFSA